MTNGAEVYYEDTTSHAATHLADTPQLLPVLRLYLEQASFTEDRVRTDVDTGNIIGNTDLVETTPADEIIYAKRLNRDNYTKFVKDRAPSSTTFFTVVLHKDPEGNYELASAWVGRMAPNFPDDVSATPESRPFWDRHALVYGNQAIQPGTLTTVCPW